MDTLPQVARVQGGDSEFSGALHWRQPKYGQETPPQWEDQYYDRARVRATAQRLFSKGVYSVRSTAVEKKKYNYSGLLRPSTRGRLARGSRLINQSTKEKESKISEKEAKIQKKGETWKLERKEKVEAKRQRNRDEKKGAKNTDGDR